jgi:copper(I)-binding protein
MRRLLWLPYLLALTAAAHAEGTITIDHAWSRPAAAGQVGVIYLTITDSGPPDALTAVATPIAADAMLHESSTKGGMAEMRMIDQVPVAAGKPARLAPGGMHVMLMGLKKKLAPGDTFPVTLTFTHAGQITTTVTVARPGSN